MSDLFVLPRQSVFDGSGNPLNGGLLNFYETGTTTRLDTFSDDALSTANANPVVADSAGRFGAIFMKDQDYKVVLTDSDAVEIWNADPVRGGVDNIADDTFRTNLTTAGSANAYTLASNRTFSAYASGQVFIAKASFENTGSATLNVTPAGGSALGAKTIKKNHDKDLVAADIENGQFCMFVFDGTNMQLISTAAVTNVSVRNLLVNGCFRLDQRRGDGTAYTAATTPLNSDDTFLLDRWLLLSDGNDACDVSQETTTVPTGAYASIKLDVETANKKFGLLQVLEARDAASIIGGVASLSFVARRTGTSITNLRAAVLAWDSTADAVTSDVVSAWGVANVNPTLVSNWTFENTPASLATLTTGFQTFKIENISIDTASTTNVAVFIWIDDVTTTSGDFVYIANVQLEEGPNTNPFELRPVSEELALCQRYFCKTFPQAVIPVQNVGDEIGALHSAVHVAGTAGQTSVVWDFPVTMRGTPSITSYSPGAASSAWWNVTTIAQASGAASTLGAGDRGVTIFNAQLANDAVQDSVAIHAVAESEL